MDVRAFGSIFGQSAALPYASGLSLTAGQNANFQACRGIYVGPGATTATQIVVIMADVQKSPVTFSGLASSSIIPISVTTVSGTSNCPNVVILF